MQVALVAQRGLPLQDDIMRCGTTTKGLAKYSKFFHWAGARAGSIRDTMKIPSGSAVQGQDSRKKYPRILENLALR